MSEITTAEPTKIEFIQYHQPGLKDGDYEITVKQTIKSEEKKFESTFTTDKASTNNSENKPLRFSVAGERFELKPTIIHTIFPPAGSLGEHSNVLPHIIFNRSTLPWERLPFKDAKDANFKITTQSLKNLELENVPKDSLTELENIKDKDFSGEKEFLNILQETIGKELTDRYKSLILQYANQNLSWVALLLFEEEQPKSKIITLRKLKQIPDQIHLDIQNEVISFLETPESKHDKIWLLNENLTETEILTKSETEPNIYFPNFDKETGQHWDDKVIVIDVTKDLLDKILPTKEDLEYLAHVRQGTDKDGKLFGDELAVIIGTRLPKKGSINHVHLVSIEGRYNANAFNFQGAGDKDYIRLVSLKSWGFACVDEKQNFKRLLTHLNRGQFLFSITNKSDKSELISKISKLTSSNPDNPDNPDVIDNLKSIFESQNISLSNPKLKVDEEKILWRIINDDNQQYSIEKVGDRLDIYRRNLSTLRLPKLDNIEAEKYLSRGYVPLPHFLRKGGKTFSWYHSPLIPGNSSTDDSTLPVRAADELVRYNPSNGMFDISYAAAWELGRLQALESSNFSISLYNWKRSHRQSIKRIEKAIDSHLPFHKPLNVELPNEILSWFENLSLLKGIPFNYLVPDEQMLPIESIRFFCVDSRWIECLLDGAFSIGRVTTSDYNQDLNHENTPAANPHKQVSGLLLRSDVVAGWPSLQVDGYDTIIDDDNAISNNLNREKIPENLRQKFEEPDILLSENAKKLSISIIEKDKKWKIHDQENNKLYNIHKEDDKVVYIQLPLLRQDRLSANVLICLFDGEIKTVDIHQKPETLHFGLDSDDNNTRFYKKLKNKNGEQVNILVDPIPWKKDKKNIRTIDISQLQEAITTQLRNDQITFDLFTSAQFALEMIEGVEKVRFTAN